MPLWPSVAFFGFRNLGLLVLFLASIVRVFLRLQVWVKIRYRNKNFGLVLLACVFRWSRLFVVAWRSLRRTAGLGNCVDVTVVSHQ